MKKNLLAILLLTATSILNAQTNPAILNWLQNTTGILGSHYVSGNSTAIQDNDSANVKTVLYSTNWAYIRTNGVPSYVTGPFLDGNPSLTTSQNAIFKMPLNPVQNTGTPTATTGGNIGLFINGVALFDYRDGVAWNTNTNALCGGPGNPPCPGGPTATQSWNRDAVPAERIGFDCSKGHPAMGNYHHHQNPSAFDLDLNVISTICNLYDADGLYAIDSTQHSPLIGFAYDGFPIYGAYGYLNTNGTGGVVRMKSGYQLRNITARTVWADGTDVPDGPAVSTTYPLGYFREDYEFVSHPADPDYLDEHNGRFCVTPEYPNGIYCYFATVDANWNSAYPYVVGPTFYGVKTGVKVTSITEPVTVYVPSTSGISVNDEEKIMVSVFPNPANDLVVIQFNGLNKQDIQIQLFDIAGKMVSETNLRQGSTIAFFDTKTLYSGEYFIRMLKGAGMETKKIIIQK
ncbi:MAG TPA: YHYH protein [Bacteroidia bacterium]|nr:YHYH protein [Bacteroidia bacterium]